MNTHQRYRAAIIGHTGLGNYGHGLDTCFSGLEQIDVVAVADPDPEGREAARIRSGAVHAYADYQQMLDRERPEIVAIAPRLVDERIGMITAAVTAGCHLYVEKPLVATLADADAMLTLCEQAGVRIAVAHQNRLHPVTLHIQRLLAEGRIGRLRQVRGYGKMDHRGGGQDLAVLGPHILDLMRLFAGNAHWCSADLLVGARLAESSDVRRGAEGVGPVLGDGLRATYGFDDGVIGSFESYRDLGDGDTVFGIDLVGEQGQLAFRGSFTKRLFFYPYPYPEPGLEADHWEQVPVPTAGRDEQLSDSPPDAAGHHQLSQCATQRVVLDLLAAIEEGREPASSG
ncbi:MAG: Gfo/Idh/MocA family protein, partial [Thermomicrobiales bacterium]